MNERTIEWTSERVSAHVIVDRGIRRFFRLFCVSHKLRSYRVLEHFNHAQTKQLLFASSILIFVLRVAFVCCSGTLKEEEEEITLLC